MNRTQKTHEQKSPKKKLLIAIAICSGILVAVSFIALFRAMKVGAAASEVQGVPPLTVTDELPASSEPAPPPQPVVTRIRFSASGDDLIHDGLYLQAQKRGGGAEYDFGALYENVAAFYQDYDVNWINQETLVSDEFAPSGYPMFCSPTAVAKRLYEIGFRVFSLSNNHSYDKGAAGIASTLAFWQTMPGDTIISGFYQGEADYENIAIQEVNGVRIAYLSYTEHTNGLPTPSGATANVIYTSQTDVIQKQIELARTQADVVICCVHMGTENSHSVNDAQRTLGQQMADFGADVILGTHPHVVQPVELFTAQDGRTVPFFYSLGNFVSTQAQVDNLIGLVATFDIVKTTAPTGEHTIAIEGVKVHPLIMHYDANYANARVYWVKDYTDALAATHGNRSISLPYIHQVLEENIDPQFLES